MSPTWEAIGKFIKEIGFPIFVAVYLLVQFVTLTPKIDAIARSLNEIEYTQRLLLWELRREGPQPNRSAPAPGSR